MHTQTSLFREIQLLLERTYSAVGLNLEECIIGPTRCKELSRAAGKPVLSPHARTFLRCSGSCLHVGIFFSDTLIQKLENSDPRQSLHKGNIRELLAFIEEINHAVHAALLFQQGIIPKTDEDYILNLELQAAVDSYLIVILFANKLIGNRELSKTEKDWLRYECFRFWIRQGQDQNSSQTNRRYFETNILAAIYTNWLDTLRPSDRLAEIRAFQKKNYREKKQHILEMTNTHH
ncbi:MAG: hypothetical protein N2035_05385 [Chthoniobacterales bacterium]|nr:hypothetical protein [Chthoniobacterales bacterium]